MPTHTLIQYNAINHALFPKSDKVNKFLSVIAVYYRRRHTRKQLAKLSPKQLNDIGLSQEQALEESLKPFWK